jgi:hypothetical protein
MRVSLSSLVPSGRPGFCAQIMRAESGFVYLRCHIGQARKTAAGLLTGRLPPCLSTAEKTTLLIKLGLLQITACECSGVVDAKPPCPLLERAKARGSVHDRQDYRAFRPPGYPACCTRRRSAPCACRCWCSTHALC